MLILQDLKSPTTLQDIIKIIRPEGVPDHHTSHQDGATKQTRWRLT